MQAYEGFMVLKTGILSVISTGMEENKNLSVESHIEE